MAWKLKLVEVGECGFGPSSRGVHSLLYFAYTCVLGPIYWGVIYIEKMNIRCWYFTCKVPKHVICDGILHVNMFHYFNVPYITCKCFTKFTYNEYIGPNFLSHVVSKKFPVPPPPEPIIGSQIVNEV